MDTKQASDGLAFLRADLENLMDMHAQDFSYFSFWLRDLDDKVKGFDARILKLEKSGQFADILKAAVPPAPVVQVQKLSKVRLALAIGVGVYVGIKINETLKSKKEK